jgi:hypothetical protein
VVNASPQLEATRNTLTIRKSIISNQSERCLRLSKKGIDMSDVFINEEYVIKLEQQLAEKDKELQQAQLEFGMKLKEKDKQIEAMRKAVGESIVALSVHEAGNEDWSYYESICLDVADKPDEALKDGE